MKPYRVRRRTRRRLKMVLRVGFFCLFVYVIADLLELSDSPTGFVQTPESRVSHVFDSRTAR
jgi:hypothetical protein